MGFNLYEKVRIKKDTPFFERNVIIKAGEIGIIVDISRSLINPNKVGYTLEFPEHIEVDPTFIFDEDQLEKI